MWQPDIYEKFREERSRPFFDLLHLADHPDPSDIIDLGCGTGRLTAVLADKFPGARVTGIDDSPRMLAKADLYPGANLSFGLRSIESECRSPAMYDLIFSNAALQWVPDHEVLLKDLIDKVNPGGQLAIQMPCQRCNLTNQLLNEAAALPPFRPYLHDLIDSSPVLTAEEYARLIFQKGGMDMVVLEKIYPLVLKDADELFDWVSGTALLRYTDRLDEHMRSSFEKEYRSLLSVHFPGTPVFYPFRRILIRAVFK